MTCVEALVDARGRGRALGAFNVYTLEGALAVARGAAAARRAAIVQLHPAALDHGGPALLAACRRLADAAEVPLFECSDVDITTAYYYRWRVFWLHLKRDARYGYTLSEFLPRVGWSGP